jgi:putative acetyltransferase
MSVRIRSEEVRDYGAIAELLALAFAKENRPGMGEEVLVDLLRRSGSFSPELALVAERDGAVVGHALYTFYDVNFSGQVLRGAMLAPLAVHPRVQKTGVGTALLAEGRARLEASGCPFTFHYGVPSYYTRHGYDNNMFGQVCVRVKRGAVATRACELPGRPFAAADLDAVTALWRLWFSDVDFALFPGGQLLDWAGTFAHVPAVVFESDGVVKGYLRHDRFKPGRVTCFLAADAESVQAMVAWLGQQYEGEEVAHIDLPVHPHSRMTRSCFSMPWEAVMQPFDAGFLMVLDEACEPVVRYRDGVKAGTTPLGIHLYPPAFEFD